MIEQMTVEELKKRMDQGNAPFLLDIREPFEREICKLTDDKHIPMREVPTRFSELDPSKELVVYCRSGQRSMQVCLLLAQQGFQKVSNLKGGILAWADAIDPTVPHY